MVLLVAWNGLGRLSLSTAIWCKSGTVAVVVGREEQMRYQTGTEKRGFPILLTGVHKYGHGDPHRSTLSVFMCKKQTEEAPGLLCTMLSVLCTVFLDLGWKL